MDMSEPPWLDAGKLSARTEVVLSAGGKMKNVRHSGARRVSEEYNEFSSSFLKWPLPQRNSAGSPRNHQVIKGARPRPGLSKSNSCKHTVHAMCSALPFPARRSLMEQTCGRRLPPIQKRLGPEKDLPRPHLLSESTIQRPRRH